MNTEIYYFSGTGNSLHVAKEMQRRIPEAKLIPMVGLLNQEIIETSGQTVGFIFPIYLMTVPAPVRKFLQKLDLKSARYIFSIATRIGTASVANIHIAKILKEKGKSLDAFFHLNMANNSPTGLMPTYLPGFKAKVQDWVNQITREKVAKLETDVQERLDGIQQVIINQEKNAGKDSFFLHCMASLMSLAQNANEKKNIEIDFYSAPNCTGCGVCEKVCLSKKIKMIQEKPVWQKDARCYYCYACFNYCPVQAILIKDKYSEQKGRYFHPEVTPNEIAGQK